MESQSTDVGVYKPKESKVRVQGYVPRSLRDSVVVLGEVWSFMDKLDDPKASAWNESEILQRLLEAAEEQAWKDLGGQPIGDKAKEDLFARLRSEHRNAKK